MAKGGNGKGGSTTDYGLSLAEFTNGGFTDWRNSCSALKNDCDKIPVYSNAANVNGGKPTLNDCINDAQAKADDLSKRLDKLENPSTFTVPPSLSVKIFDGSVTGVSCSFTGSSVAGKWLEFSVCGLFISISGVSAMHVFSDIKYKTREGFWNGFWTIVFGGLNNADAEDERVAALKRDAAARASTNAPLKERLGVLMHF